MSTPKTPDKYIVGQKVIGISGVITGVKGIIIKERIFCTPTDKDGKSCNTDWYYYVDFEGIGSHPGHEQWSSVRTTKEEWIRPLDDDESDGLGNTDSRKKSSWDEFTRATGYTMPTEVHREHHRP